MKMGSEIRHDAGILENLASVPVRQPQFVNIFVTMKGERYKKLATLQERGPH